MVNRGEYDRVDSSWKAGNVLTFHIIRVNVSYFRVNVVIVNGKGAQLRHPKGAHVPLAQWHIGQSKSDGETLSHASRR